MEEKIQIHQKISNHNILPFLQNNLTSNQSQLPILPPPLFNILSPPQLKLDPTHQKLLASFQNKFSNQQSQMQKRFPKLQQKDPSLALQGQSTGDNRTINITLLYQCLYCEHWIFKQQKNMHQSAHPSEILKYLYLSGINCAKNLKQLNQRLNINAILNCANQCSNQFQSLGIFQYKKLTLLDNLQQNIRIQFQQNINWIKKMRDQGKRILVHCAQGRSRSVTIVLAYLMKQYKKSLRQAYEITKNARPIISPNGNYVLQLLQYEKQLFGIQQNSIKGQQILPLFKFISNLKSRNQ